MRALGAMYLRLVGDTMECYNYLEPLYNDYRKLKRKKRDGRMYKSICTYPCQVMTGTVNVLAIPSHQVLPENTVEPPNNGRT